MSHTSPHFTRLFATALAGVLSCILFGVPPAFAEPPSPGPSASPAPSEPALPVIGGTKASYVCSSLREALAPAVYDVMTVDRLIVTERSTLADMAKTSGDPQAREKLEGSGAMNMMRTRLSAAVVATARNLGAVDALLKERTADSAANADDRRALADVQTALRRVAKEQNEALNTVAGYLETELQGQMRTEYDSQLLEAVGPVGGSAKLQPPLTGSGLQMNEPIPVFDRRTLLTNDTAFGRTVYDELSRSLARHQQMIAKSESAVSPSIVKLAAKCGGTKP